MSRVRLSQRVRPTIPAPDLDDHLTDQELRIEIARLAGVLAHRMGVQPAFRVLMRIGGALGTEGTQQ